MRQFSAFNINDKVKFELDGDTYTGIVSGFDESRPYGNTVLVYVSSCEFYWVAPESILPAAKRQATPDNH